MTFPWSAKNRESPPEAGPASGPEGAPGPVELADVLRELGRAGELLAAANQKIADYLAQRGDGTAQAVERLQNQLDRGFLHLAELLAPRPAPARSQEGGVSLADWERAVLGDELAGQPGLAFQRNQLLSGVLEGEAAACALAGQLLVFRSAAAERLPPLLKEIGEAYYRWQPKNRPGNSPFEESLAAWLQRKCEAAGLHNTIELVHPGERFDAARHNASSRGVEITEVLGWVVLRDNGKVYTKATVSVR